MATKLSIIKDAVGTLGDFEILTLDDTRKANRYAKMFYDNLRDALIADHPWNFAMKRVSPSPDTGTPAFGYDYQFTLPGDCLRVWSVNEEDGGVDWAVEGGKLLCSEESPDIRYIGRADEALFSPGFVDAFQYQLSAKLAMPVTDNASLFDSLMKIAGDKVMNAKAADGQEGTSLQETESPIWDQARL